MPGTVRAVAVVPAVVAAAPHRAGIVPKEAPCRLSSLEAEITSEPAARAVTRPETDIVPTLTLLELQIIARPVTTLLLESRVVAAA